MTITQTPRHPPVGGDPRSPAVLRKVSLRTRLRRDGPLLVMAVPIVVLLLVFAYVPMLGNVIAWKDYSPYTGILDSPWVGWRNFERVVADEAFWSAVANTLAITAFQLVFYFPVPIVLALVLNTLLSARIKMTIQAITYLPHFFSWVIVVAIFQQIFGGAGLLNEFLTSRGYEPLEIMTNPDVFILLLTAQSVWRDAGWGMIVFLAALSTVQTEQYEAAAVDGASALRRMWHITLPALKPVIILLLILRLGDSLSVGFEQLILQREAVGAQAAEVLDTFVYYTGVIYGDWSYGAAAGLIKGVVSMLLVVGANKVAHVFGEAGVYQR
ncbi:ABC transporter permease [Desertihabitans aurantiacus]|uniref:ABC transporter permease n=1 Tax=Desertihabitans aurantiacus TaxID=2282477 RepID=UPI000DF74E1E|nr:ABC transporter permease subunit [Desertihabitans aurantiacus]